MTLTDVEKRFSYLFDLIGDPVVEFELVDETPVIRTVNPAFEDVFGYDREGMLDESLNDFIVPEEATEESSRFDQQVANGQHTSGVVTRITADGPREFLYRGVPYERDGRRHGFAIYTDITARHRRQQELQRQKRLLDALFEFVPIHLFVKDTEGRHEWISSALVDEPREWLGKTDREVGTTPELSEQTYADDMRVIEDEERIIDKEEYNAALDRWFLTSKVPWYDTDGNVIGLLGYSFDITERKEREQELKRKDRIFDEAPVGIVISDPDAPDNPLVDVNDHFEETTGYSAEEVCGQNCRFLQGEKTEDEPVEAMREAIGDGEQVTVKLRNYRKNGEEYWVRVSIAPVRDDSGEIINYVGFQTDISEQKEYEQRLQDQRDKLEEKNELLEEFAQIASHDLRNPLNVANLRLAELREEQDNEQLEEIATALDRMETIIDETLELAKQDSTVTQTESMQLSAVASECWQTVDTGEASLDVTTGATIRGNRSHLKQLFENLFRNAIEHGDEDTTISVGMVESVSAPTRVEPDDTYNGFYVADDGPGIPKDQREAIFDSGYSTDGAGLGLSIVQQIVEAHDWSVWVTESVDGGARFEITGVECISAWA